MKEINNKGGRPPKPGYKKRGKPVMTRFTAAEYAIVQQRAQNANLEMVDYIRSAAGSGTLDGERAVRLIAKFKDAPLSEFVRYAALRAEVRTALTEEELSAVKELTMQLRNIGTNINAIARKANSGLARDYTTDLRQILSDLSKAKDSVIQKLLKDDWKD